MRDTILSQLRQQHPRSRSALFEAVKAEIPEATLSGFLTTLRELLNESVIEFISSPNGPIPLGEQAVTVELNWVDFHS